MQIPMRICIISVNVHQRTVSIGNICRIKPNIAIHTCCRLVRRIGHRILPGRKRSGRFRRRVYVLRSRRPIRRLVPLLHFDLVHAVDVPILPQRAGWRHIPAHTNIGNSGRHIKLVDQIAFVISAPDRIGHKRFAGVVKSDTAAGSIVIFRPFRSRTPILDNDMISRCDSNIITRNTAVPRIKCARLTVDEVIVRPRRRDEQVPPADLLVQGLIGSGLGGRHSRRQHRDPRLDIRRVRRIRLIART